MQGLLAIIDGLPSGLWQWSDSGTPFTLEEDPPCGGIYGSTKEFIISDGKGITRKSQTKKKEQS